MPGPRRLKFKCDIVEKVVFFKSINFCPLLFVSNLYGRF